MIIVVVAVEKREIFDTFVDRKMTSWLKFKRDKGKKNRFVVVAAVKFKASLAMFVH